MDRQFSTLSHLLRDKRARLQAIIGLLVLVVGLILSIAGFLQRVTVLVKELIHPWLNSTPCVDDHSPPPSSSPR